MNEIHKIVTKQLSVLYCIIINFKMTEKLLKPLCLYIYSWYIL